MGRRSYQYFQQSDFRGGINTEPENADPSQVIDARNVWAPDGKLVERPGYYGVGISAATSSIFASSAEEKLSDGASVAKTLDLDGLTEYYIGWTDEDDGVNTFGVITLNGTNTNTLALAKIQYYNGSSWTKLNDIEYQTGGTAQLLGSDYHLQNNSAAPILTFPVPGDWATTEVASTTGYWLRVNLLTSDGSSAALTMAATTTVSLAAGDTGGRYDFAGAFSLQGSSTKTTMLVLTDTGTSGLGPYIMANTYEGKFPKALRPIGIVEGSKADEKATAIIIPFTNDVFFSYNHKVYEPVYMEEDPVNWFLQDPIVTAKIEDDPVFVGEITYGQSTIKAPYHPDYVAQDGSFPQAKYLTYQDGVIFTANQKEASSVIKWSAPFPAYRVWPSTSFAALDDDDNSPITGLTTLGENVIVFKRDSIWQMVPQGSSDIGQPIYVPSKIVSGIGCVSNASIQQTPLGLIFLAEDGVYLFDGTPQARKLSGALDDWFRDRVSPTGFLGAASVHWRTNNCYLLSSATDGSSSENNVVFVYDYKHNAWWIWDNMSASDFLLQEGTNDLEELFFFNYKAQAFQIGGRTDNGAAIGSYFKTHRLGYNDFTTKSLREVRVWGNNGLLTGTVAVSGNDAEPAQNTATLSFADTLESKWAAGIWGTAKWVAKRRRQKRATCRVDGEWFQVKVTNGTRGRPLEVTNLTMGYVPKGRR